MVLHKLSRDLSISARSSTFSCLPRWIRRVAGHWPRNLSTDATIADTDGALEAEPGDG